MNITHAELLIAVGFFFAEPEALICMARVIHTEARGEPVEGQLAVGYTPPLLTRAQDDPSRVCAEALRPHQFSYGVPATADSFRIAHKVLTNSVPNPVPNATHFHSGNLPQTPYLVRRIENHAFHNLD